MIGLDRINNALNLPIPKIEDLGIPRGMLPAPFPFPPFPRVLVNEANGLTSWSAVAVRDMGEMEDLGTVWGITESEAIEAAENVASEGGSFNAVQVRRS